MRYWYFEFEAEVVSQNNEFGNATGLFSNAMSLGESKSVAEDKLSKSLHERGLKLINIENYFEFKPNEVDMNNKENLWWVSMYDEVKKFKKCVFTEWHTYKGT